MKRKKIIKIDVNMFENSKFKLIERYEKRDMITVIWMKLLTEAAKTNDCGLIYLTKNKAYSFEMLSTILNRNVDDIKYAIEVLVKLEMVRINNENIIEIINWCQYQEPKRKAKEKFNQESREVKKVNNEDIVQEEGAEKANKKEELQPENLAEKEDKKEEGIKPENKEENPKASEVSGSNNVNFALDSNKSDQDDNDNGDIRAINETFVEGDDDPFSDFDIFSDYNPFGKTMATFSFLDSEDDKNDDDKNDDNDDDSGGGGES